MRILLLGDAHGHFGEVNARLCKARDLVGAEAGIQLGDLGLDRQSLAAFARAHGRFALPLHVIDGNHDDHALLAKALRNGESERWAKELGLFVQPRPSVVAFGSAKVGFLGGALHVVRPQRHGLFSGAPNYVPKKQALAAAQLFDREKPSLVVTHSCPAGIGIGMRGHPSLLWGLHEHVVQAGFDPGPNDDRGEPGLRTLWQHMTHRPRVWAFGHFHDSHQKSVDGTLFVSVDVVAPDRASPLLLWDSESGNLSLGE